MSYDRLNRRGLCRVSRKYLRVFTALIRHHHHKQLVGKEFISIILLYHKLSPTEVRAGTQGKNLEAKGNRGHGGVPLACSLSLVQPAFLQHPGPVEQAWHQSQWAGPSHTSHNQENTHTTDLPVNQSGEVIFSSKGPLSPMTLTCVKMT